ncbi:MAG: RidA family protein [Legionellaceae bacterium]|nr:RidA family protein [Legionellaceae bacterium]
MQPILTTKAPAAIGTYSQAVRVGNTVYLSGQIPLDPETMVLCSDEINLQIKQVLENLQAVCRAAGGDFSDLVKVTVYLIDLNHFPLVNQAMEHYFTEPYPARAVIGVAGLPRGAQVEMDAVMITSHSSEEL